MPVQDFNAMRSQAIKNAREMHKRAQPNTEPAFQNATTDAEHLKKNDCQPEKKQNSNQQFPSMNDIFGHHKSWTQSEETPFCKNACPVKNTLGIGSKGFDSESMLLMAIMLLLATDGGDRMLMLALLYIMT